MQDGAFLKGCLHEAVKGVQDRAEAKCRPEALRTAGEAARRRGAGKAAVWEASLNDEIEAMGRAMAAAEQAGAFEDPLVEARSKRLEAEGRSVFNDYFMPEATLALKQGAGRLIRRESDRGILVVCDTRLVQMGYGRRLVKALPPMRRLQTPEDLAQALEALTRPSTTDLCWP